jgi:hypothetical protein
LLPDLRDLSPVPCFREDLAKAAMRRAPAGDAAGSAIRRVRAVATLPRRAPKRAAAVAVIGALAAVLVGLLGTTAGGPAKAWSATSTTAADTQLQTAEAACVKETPSVAASLTPMITDTRGPYSMIVWDAGERVIVCVGGTRGAVFCAVIWPRTTALAPDAVALESSGSDVPAGQQGQSAAVLSGRVGANVTSVTLLLDDGSSVQTTVDNGWFVAWWTGSPGAVRSAQITTAAATTTEPLNVPPPPVLPAGGATSGSGASGGTPTNRTARLRPARRLGFAAMPPCSTPCGADA